MTHQNSDFDNVFFKDTNILNDKYFLGKMVADISKNFH